MKADLNVELYAIAVGVEGETGVGSIRHDLEIVTETDVLFLPIVANILLLSNGHKNEELSDKTYDFGFVGSEDYDQPEHLPSLI